jgi:hypothetical protein
MSKPLRAGSEVDAHCGACKLDLLHRVIAMEGHRIARAECLTCHAQHRYRAPLGRSEAPVAPVLRSTGEPAVARPPASTRAARERSPAAERRAPPSRTSMRTRWESSIAGKTAADFAAYRADVRLAPGQLVRHGRFGDGVVTDLVEGDKVLILFADGPRTLVHGRGGAAAGPALVPPPFPEGK